MFDFNNITNSEFRRCCFYPCFHCLVEDTDCSRVVFVIASVAFDIIETFFNGGDGEGDKERQKSGEWTHGGDDGDELEARNEQEIQVERSSELFEQVLGDEGEGRVTRVTDGIITKLRVVFEGLDDSVLKFFIFFSGSIVIVISSSHLLNDFGAEFSGTTIASRD